MNEIDPRELPDRGIYRLTWGNHSTFCRIQRLKDTQYIRYYADDEDRALTDPDWSVESGNVTQGSAWYRYDVDRLPDADPRADRITGTFPRLYLIDDPDHGGIAV